MPKSEELQNKRWSRYFGRVESFLTRSNVNDFPSNIVANLCLPLSRGGWAISFFIQDIVANAFVVMVDIYESRGVRKYQHLVMLLLIDFFVSLVENFCRGSMNSLSAISVTYILFPIFIGANFLFSPIAAPESRKISLYIYCAIYGVISMLSAIVWVVESSELLFATRYDQTPVL